MTAERSNRIGAINSEAFSAVMACRRLRPGLRLRASLRGTIVADGSLRANRALLVAHGPPRTRVPEGRSKIGRRFSAGFLRFQIDPVPEGRGERCGQKMIRVAALFCDGAKVWPEPCSYRRSQPRFAVLCAENIMDQNRAKGVGHCETYTGNANNNM